MSFAKDPTREILDITKIQTLEDLNSTDFKKYECDQHEAWVRHINNPVAQDDLNRICDLSEEEGAKVQLGWTMGELYYRIRVLPQVKKLKQVALFA